jgi:hypothetical protein
MTKEASNLPVGALTFHPRVAQWAYLLGGQVELEPICLLVRTKSGYVTVITGGEDNPDPVIVKKAIADALLDALANISKPIACVDLGTGAMTDVPGSDTRKG